MKSPETHLTERRNVPVPALEVEGLTFRPNGKAILDRVGFVVHPGEFVAIMGPNGAGKSTLLKHLNRILPVRQGHVRVAGRPVESYGYRALAREMAYVPQAKGFIPPYRVMEFLLLSRHPHLGLFASPGSAEEERALQALELVGMGEFSERTLDSLSGGERQKIYIAAAVVQETPMILLDEPATYLDPHHTLEIYALLRDLNRKAGKTVVMVTHEVNAALTLAHRVLCLRNGRVLFYGSPCSLLEGGRLDEVYGVPFHKFECISHPGQEWAYLPMHPGGEGGAHGRS